MTTGAATRLALAGRVQGVDFRYALRDKAAQLGLVGWVRNRADGTVEACVQGPADAVQRLVAWATRGPPPARVNSVEVSQVEAPSPVPSAFEIWPTA